MQEGNLTLDDIVVRYASLWQDSFFSLPIKRADGTQLSHEDVINQLNECVTFPAFGLIFRYPTNPKRSPFYSLSVQYYTDYGCAGAFQDLLRIQIKVEKHQYESTIAWLRDLIWGSTFVKDQLEVTIAKLVQELPQQKRDGDSVARSVSESMIMDEDKSTSVSNSLLRQLEFLPEVAARLKEDPESVVKDLEKFRDTSSCFLLLFFSHALLSHLNECSYVSSKSTNRCLWGYCQLG